MYFSLRNNDDSKSYLEQIKTLNPNITVREYPVAIYVETSKETGLSGVFASYTFLGQTKQIFRVFNSSDGVDIPAHLVDTIYSL